MRWNKICVGFVQSSKRLAAMFTCIFTFLFTCTGISALQNAKIFLFLKISKFWRFYMRRLWYERDKYDESKTLGVNY